MESAQTSSARELAEVNMMKLETIREGINRILTPVKENPLAAELPTVNLDNKSEALSQNEVAGSTLPCLPNAADGASKDALTKSEIPKDTEMDETKNDGGINETMEKSDAGVIVLD